MAGCDAHTFNGVTPEEFACIARKAEQESGLTLSGNNGSALAPGISVNWNFDPASYTLTIQCMDKPFLLPCATINSQIRNLVDGCLGR